MKRRMAGCLLLIFVFASPVYALDWAYSFVVWNGNVYEVTDVQISQNDLGPVIGEVKRKANDTNGNYYGDASNTYEKGTKYFEIKEIDSLEAIAVEDSQHIWKKANYLHEAPSHWMDWIPYILGGGAFLVGLVYFAIRFSNKKMLHPR
ncbi:hypothetical protein [Sutcliffiella rhizosphaerae]|uniref:Nickel transport protein n=1 Tax=Sutcliffiella rhizosphaerae TaxID=2880967 RepID=A0ABM8YHS1_9BACI|nr:hypothetical protein [Sutcliffiella rhizosphaerae]CAG9619260.1 hypothetical protein BACCIP111883_00027 [Sutcliffiella rhizosphaerae]